MNTNPTQATRILAHMEIHGSITPKESIEFFACYRLAARIYELRARGHAIDCDMEGGYARYSLASTPTPQPV